MDTQSKRMASLSLVATPIGNLGDITLRALETLKSVDLIACEDTRVTAKLLSHYGIKTPTTSYHEHNAAKERPKLLQKMQEGAHIALVSDAGTPLISDPGYKLVIEARAFGLSVTSLPGASSVITAISASGQPTDAFTFLGFLPTTTRDCLNLLHSVKQVPASLIVFSTGPKLAGDAASLLEGLGDRSCTMARELTKLYEEYRTQNLSDWAQEPTLKGEIVLVIAPPAEAPMEDAELKTLLAERLKTLSVKDAVAEVAALTGAPKKHVYHLALELSK